MTRKTFIKKSILTSMLALPVIAFLQQCANGDDSSGSGTPGTCSSSDANVSIGSNHSHLVTVTKADVDAATDKQFTLSGGGHSHTFTLTTVDFSTLKSGSSVSKTSSNDGHSHALTITCGT